MVISNIKSDVFNGFDKIAMEGVCPRYIIKFSNPELKIHSRFCPHHLQLLITVQLNSVPRLETNAF